MMDDIMREVQTYDCSTLRQKLIQHGVSVGPIPKTSIALFQRRLAKELFRQQGGVEEEANNEAETTERTGSNNPVTSVSSVKSETVGIVPDVFYAVCLPAETSDGSAADELVFSDKALALKTAKQYKGSRFKVFKSEEDAKIFSKLKAETAFQSPRRPSKEETPTKETIQAVSESSPFKAPRPQDLSKLRNVIEQGDVVSFKKQVWENPRYLVSGGDTPSIYQEGPRYTAMHIAAIKNRPEVCQAILDILEDPQFVNTLYSQSKLNEETQNSRINFLVDLYLNMPDKGCCESPLHMACKYGYDQVVEILAAHPRTDKEMKNKWGDSAKELICSRCQTPSPLIKKKIEELLKGQCYVPLIRSEDNTAPAVIGQPWSPDINKSLIDLPRITHSPIESSLTVRACAGPMSPSDAGIFHKRWTTPPTSSPEQKKAYFNTKRSDSEKGMERIGRQLAHEMHIPWSEYWEFLDQFIDMSTSTGLDMLENYLKKRSWLKFVKDFKDRFYIDDPVIDFQGVTTPITTRTGLVALADSSKSVDSVFGSPSNNNNKLNSNNAGTLDKDKTEIKEDNSTDKKTKSVSDIVSPVTNLSMKFSRMKLNDSWSEKATLDSFQELDSLIENTGTENDNIEQIKHVAETASEENLVEKKSETKDVSSSDNTEKVQANGVERTISLERSKSPGSDSTASYETAPEDETYSSLPFDSLSSEPAPLSVSIKLKDESVFEQIQSIGDQNVISNNVAKLVVQLKDSIDGEGFKVTVVSIPEIENVQQLNLLEDLDVESIEGNISSVAEGEIVQICATCCNTEEAEPVTAYLTRAVTLPKCGYIHGPQPTREDLNVSRAIGNAMISPECHPNVFSWKISLSKFVRDTNYRWQSPAKLSSKSKIRSSSPLASPLGQKSPIIPYRSSASSSNQQPGVITSDIRTKLFPSIME